MGYQDFLATTKLKSSIDQRKEATFVPNKNLPVYNWFYYKEGFSRDLVFSLIERFDLGSDSTVLDPFCGSGTTLLACKQRGISAVGFDVLPISLFAAKVKTADYAPQELKDTAKQLLKTKFRKIFYEYPPLLKKNFSRFALEDISVFREAAMNIESKKLRDFFLLALINSAIKCSYAWKDGGVIKTRKRPVPPLRIMFRRVVYGMIRDYEHFERSDGSEIAVEKCDARRMKLADGSVNAIITSPPYLNNIDYTKVYEIEQFLLHEKEDPAVRSYIGLEKEIENKVLPELDLPPAAAAYFTDMLASLKEMHRSSGNGAHAALVVGNAYFPETQQIIDSDTILAYLAEQTGFSVEEIAVLNERFALENRTQKKGILRESMIVLSKI
jgi:SAM-dependent methyltransferase